MRRARGWFGGEAGPRGDDRRPSDDDEREARDWLQGWDVDDEASDADPDAFDTGPALGRAVTPGNAVGQRYVEAPGAPLEAARRRPDAATGGDEDGSTDEATDEATHETTNGSTHELAGGVEDDDSDARAARSAASEPSLPAERPDGLADAPRETTDQPATPAARSAASRTPLFPASTDQDPTDRAPTDQRGQAAGDAPATPADSDPAPAEAAAEQVSSAKTPPVETPPVDTPPVDTPPMDTPPVDTPPERGATLPSGVPIRAERFLGGDLRTRLLRFLTSPEMPLIAKTDLIAKRFDLEPATAQEMLEDIADDPPDGLRLTVVREGAWRIERRSA